MLTTNELKEANKTTLVHQQPLECGNAVQMTFLNCYISIQFLDLTICKGFSFLRTGLLSISIYFKLTSTFSYM